MEMYAIVNEVNDTFEEGMERFRSTPGTFWATEREARDVFQTYRAHGVDSFDDARVVCCEFSMSGMSDPHKTREKDLERFCADRESWGKWKTQIVDTLFDLTCPAPLSCDEVRGVLSALLSEKTSIMEHAERVSEETELPLPVANDVVLKSAIFGVYLKIRESYKFA